MPKESRFEHFSKKIKKKYEGFKESISTTKYIDAAAEYIKEITNKVKKNAPLTEIYKMFNKGEESLLTRLKTLYKGEGEAGTVHLGWNVKKMKRTVWNWLAGNYGRTSSASLLNSSTDLETDSARLKGLREHITKGNYSTYKPCMYNMLKLLALNNTNVDWLTRLDIMSDENLVQSDFLIFGMFSRWNENVRNAAKELKDALEKITPSSLKQLDDYYVLFGGNLKNVCLYNPADGINNNYTDNDVPQSNDVKGGPPLFPKLKLTGGKALDRVREIFKHNDGLPCYLRKFITADNEYGALLNRDGVQEIYSISSDQFNKYKTEKQTFSEIVKPDV